jgi:hypothetical protein
MVIVVRNHNECAGGNNESGSLVQVRCACTLCDGNRNQSKTNVKAIHISEPTSNKKDQMLELERDRMARVDPQPSSNTNYSTPPVSVQGAGSRQ